MNPQLKQKITDKLRLFLRREPTENEILNSESDINVMLAITRDDVAAHAVKLDQIKTDTDKLKADISSVIITNK